jgi:hypothetical protein
MVAALLLAIVTGVSSPAPSPSAASLPVIAHTITTNSCAALKGVIIPVGTTLRKNDESFGGMADRLQQIFSDFANRGGAPTNEQLMQQGDSHYSTFGTNKYDRQVDPGSQSNQFYSPSQIVKASEILSLANGVYTQLTVASQELSASLTALPQGADPNTDRIRSSAQSVIALQHSFAQNYQNFVSTYVNNQNVGWTVNADQRAFVNAYLTTLLSGKEANDQSLTNSERAQIASIGAVEQNLQQNEHTFGVDLIATYNQCNGTHINIGATPSPNP